jgi:transcriptional regulator with XRE-family HTH domain
MPSATFGDRLRDAREAAGFSQTELARRAQTVQSDISLMERGAIEPGLARLVRLADALGVSIDWLAGRAAHRGGRYKREPSDPEERASA